MRINIGSKFYPVIAGCKILSMVWNVQMPIRVWLEINYVVFAAMVTLSSVPADLAEHRHKIFFYSNPTVCGHVTCLGCI